MMETEKFIYWYEFLELVLAVGLIPFLIGLVVLIIVLLANHTKSRRIVLFIVCGHFVLSYAISVVLWLLSVSSVFGDGALCVLLPCVLGEIISSAITYILFFEQKRQKK